MTDGPRAGFVEPDPSLNDLPFDALHTRLDIRIMSGHRADLSHYGADDEAWAGLLSKITIQADYEDQCSAKYYHDMYNVVMSEAETIDRIVEVGIFMGGSSVILAGCAEMIDAELVMIDIDERYLQFGYQRLIRSFPGAADRVRLFLGDLPTYARDVLVKEETDAKLMVHLDGAHSFQGVLRDLGVLSYVRDRLIGVMAQDTHLRGPPEGMRFVDAALYAVFGSEFEYLALGTSYQSWQSEMVNPNAYAGGYFLPGRVEGMYLPMSHNSFEYPHHQIRLEQFFW